jgi:chemotaxis protein CheC
MATPLTLLEVDAVTEILNIGIGRAAASLSLMVAEEIGLSVPCAELLHGAAACAYLTRSCDEMVAVRERFRGRIGGAVALLLPKARCLDLVRLVLDEDLTAEEVSAFEQEALVEIGNVLLNGCLSSVADALIGEIETSIPVFIRADLATILPPTPGVDALLLMLTVNFMIRSHDIQGQILFLMDMQAADAFKRMVACYVESVS